MILSRAPARVTLGGGGTDLKSYYSKNGGFLIAGAIDKYCTTLANRRFHDNIRLSYSQMEIRDNVADIEHRIFRSALELLFEAWKNNNRVFTCGNDGSAPTATHFACDLVKITPHRTRGDLRPSALMTISP